MLHRGMYYTDITDPEAVASNQRGEMTARQDRLIREAIAPRRSGMILGIAASIGFLGFIAVVLVNAWPMIRSPHITIVTVWLPLLIFAGMAVVVEAIFIGTVFGAWRDVQSTTDDLRRRRVVGANGVVRWGSGLYGIKTYVAYIGRRRLRAPVYSLQLPPGPYYCYYLERSGWLLSAAASVPVQASAPMAREVLVDTVAQLHDVTPGDITANRSGKLSVRQRGQRTMIALLWLAPAVVLGITALAGLLYWVVPQPAPDRIAGIALLSGGWAFLAYEAYRRMLDLIAAKPVSSAEGVLYIRHQLAYRSHTVFYVIGQYEFELSSAMMARQAYNSIIERQRYRVYYLAHSKILVSLEVLPADP